jgi:hypothetical protein
MENDVLERFVHGFHAANDNGDECLPDANAFEGAIVLPIALIDIGASTHRLQNIRGLMAGDVSHHSAA